MCCHALEVWHHAGQNDTMYSSEGTRPSTYSRNYGNESFLGEILRLRLRMTLSVTLNEVKSLLYIRIEIRHHNYESEH